MEKVFWDSAADYERLLQFKMHKMWSFSTLQRPTQEEKERKRRFREEQQQVLLKNGGTRIGGGLSGGAPNNGSSHARAVARAKTFRYYKKNIYELLDERSICSIIIYYFPDTLKIMVAEEVAEAERNFWTPSASEPKVRPGR